MKEHVETGRRILEELYFPWPVAEIVFQHHERMDGSGYPRGLKGYDILPEAMIIAVADVVEAMASHRPYRAALGLEAALAQIHFEIGTKLDEKIVNACLKVFADGYKI
jgi:HD-GYP domain-containing protein (c-di-GMP phosphodiesterase class II)